MPTYLLQLRWTNNKDGKGYDRLPLNQIDGPAGIRAIAKRYAAKNGVTVRAIHDTLRGPDWIVTGTAAAVDGVVGHFRGEGNVTIANKFQIDDDEPDRDRDSKTTDSP